MPASYEQLQHFQRFQKNKRKEYRDLAKKSLYYFSKAVLNFDRLSPNLHQDLCLWLQNTPDKRKGIRLPRDHFKTTVCTLSYSLWRIIHNPNIRIFLGTESAANAEKWLGHIEAIFEKNQIFQWLFPELIPNWKHNDRWSRKEMLIPRSRIWPEATIEVGGVDTAIVSRHYDLLILDDLVGFEAYQSPTVMEKTIEWYKATEGILLEPDRLHGSEILVLGTRWTPEDLYQYIMDNEPEIPWFARPAIVKDANGNDVPIFPERFSLETLSAIRRKMGRLFWPQFMDDPLPKEEGSFKEEWLGRYKFLDTDAGLPFLQRRILYGDKKVCKLTSLYRVSDLDPATSDSLTSSKSAIVTLGMNDDSDVFLLGCWSARVNPGELFDAIFMESDKWQPDKFGFEAVAFQKTLDWTLRRECWLRDKRIRQITPVKRGSESKFDRIDGLYKLFESGKFFAPETIPMDWLTEYTHYSPLLKKRKRGASFDCLDATRDCQDLLAPTMARSSELYESQLKKWLGRRR